MEDDTCKMYSLARATRKKYQGMWGRQKKCMKAEDGAFDIFEGKRSTVKFNDLFPIMIHPLLMTRDVYTC